jgi:Spy/CpxP family protein refolding chaperone
MARAFRQLDLSDSQKARIREIIAASRRERRAELRAVLTPEQLAKLPAPKR